MEPTDGKLGVREMASIIIICLIMKSTDTTPTLLFEEAQNSGWMTPVISGAFMLIPFILLLSLLKLYKDKGLIEIAYHLTGRYIGFIIGMGYFYILFSSLILASRSYVDIMSTLFFPRTPTFILFLIIIGTVYGIANRGYECLGRTAWMFLPILQIVFIVFVFFTEKDTNWGFIYPIAGGGVLNTIRAGITESTYLGDIFLLTVLYQYSRSHKEFVRASLVAMVISIVEITVMLVLYIIVFAYPSIIYFNYPFQELTRMASFGKYFKNTEAFYYGFWVISAMIRFSSYLYFSTAVLGHTLKLKEYEPLILPLAALVPVIGLIPENFVRNVFVYRNMILKFGWILIFSIPFILYITARVRGEYKR